MDAIIFWISVFIIFYTYAGYPVLLAFLAKFRKKPVFVASYEPAITLLIAAYNEEKCIRKKLENALSLDYPAQKYQIIVAADGSNDKTLEILNSFAQKGVVASFIPERQGKMAAIDRAINLATGDILVFSDANNIFEKNTLRNLIAPFSDPKVGGVSGAKHIIKEGNSLSESEGLYWKYESFIKFQETRLKSCVGVNGEIFAMRRSLFEPAFKGIINDDFYMAMRILKQGYKIIYSPLARSFEHVSLTAQDEIVRRTRINAGRYQFIKFSKQLLPFSQPVLVWQIFSHKYLRLLIPFAMMAAFIANFIALFTFTEHHLPSIFWLSTPYNWIIFCLQIIFYSLALIGNIARPKGKLGKLLYLPTFLVNSNLAAFKGLIGFINGNQTNLWKRVRRVE